MFNNLKHWIYQNLNQKLLLLLHIRQKANKVKQVCFVTIGTPFFSTLNGTGILTLWKGCPLGTKSIKMNFADNHNLMFSKHT
jgi:hypothetical protein